MEGERGGRDRAPHRSALVVVDGGASRCRLAAFDANGARVGTAVVESPASLTLGEREAWDTIRTGIERLARELGVPERALGRWLPTRLALGLAGALQEERRARFLARLERATGGTTRCRLVTDGHAQLVGASGGRPGVCLAIGTGSVVHWMDHSGGHGMAGGWGFPIGDEGSGAWLGARLLQRHLWHRDGETCDSPLMAALAARWGDSVSELQRLTTETRSTVHAALAPLVVGAAEAGDALALSLLEEGADWCARLVARAPPTLPVHVVGGLAGAYLPALSASLGARLTRPRGDALDGLRLIGARLLDED